MVKHPAGVDLRDHVGPQQRRDEGSAPLALEELGDVHVVLGECMGEDLEGFGGELLADRHGLGKAVERLGEPGVQGSHGLLPLRRRQIDHAHDHRAVAVAHRDLVDFFRGDAEVGGDLVKVVGKRFAAVGVVQHDPHRALVAAERDAARRDDRGAVHGGEVGREDDLGPRVPGDVQDGHLLVALVAVAALL